MLEVAEAVRLDGEAGDGRTTPFRAGIVTPQGEELDAYLKALDGKHLTVEGLMNEALGAAVAAEVGLPMPRAFVVVLSPEFVASARSAEHRRRLGLCPAAFALEALGTNWRKWNETDRVGSERRSVALQTLAFDAFIGNSDRSPIRPNLMTSPPTGALALIDHEGAFGVRMKFAPAMEPWKLGNLDLLRRVGQESEHLFFKPLSGLRDLDMQPIADAWSNLTDEVLAGYAAALPGPWEDARKPLADALHYLGTVRDRVQDCLQELRRVLA